MEMNQVNVMKEQQKEHILRKFAMDNNAEHSDTSSLIASGTHEFHMPDQDPHEMQVEPPHFQQLQQALDANRIMEENNENLHNTAEAEQQHVINQQIQRDE